MTSPEEKKETKGPAIFDDIEKLNDRMAKLFGDLYENQSHYSDEAYAYMQKCLLDEYKLLFGIMSREYRIDSLKRLYELDSRIDEFVPRGKRFTLLFWRRRNRAAKLLDQQVEQEAERYFDDLEGRLKAAQEAYDALKKEAEENEKAVR